MIDVRRLVAVGATLSLAAIVTCSIVLGEPGRGGKDKELRDWRTNDPGKASDRMARLIDERGPSRFADQPLSLYQTTTGDTLFALQVKPQLEAIPARPRDILVLVDTAAGMGPGNAFKTARAILDEVVSRLDANDRIAIWTVNTRARNLTGGFKNAEGTRQALAELAKDYPSGAANLKQALTDSIKTFAIQPGRQRLVLFLGDGKSIAGPISPEDRNVLAQDMVQGEIAYFAIPLGVNFEPLNLHGLANSTGGKVVRLPGADKEAIPEVVKALGEAVAAPILYPQRLQLPTEVVEAFPTQLPPLRGDVATLVVGKMNAAKRFDYTVVGTVNGKEQTIKAGHAVPAAEIDNFFLVNIVRQWRDQKDRPALVQADRALALAFEQNRLARTDLLTKAEWALQEDRIDPAAQLFRQVLTLDPNSDEAKTGLDLVEKLRNGQITRKQLRDQWQKQQKDQVLRLHDGAVVRLNRAEQLALLQNPDPAGNPAEQPLAGNRPGDILDEARARQAVAEQQQNQLVDEAIQRANRIVQSAPDDAHDFLKRTLDGVRNNPDIGEKTRIALSERLERTLQTVDRVGARVRRDQQEMLALRAAAAATADKERLRESNEERLRRRMEAFHALMNKARFQEATAQAQAIRSDLVSQGQDVPSAVTAAYQMGLTSVHLAEITELKRMREANFLATMLQVEKSHVPFPDEPPVVFPPSATWKALTEFRKARYESSSFGVNMPPRALELRKILGEPIRFGGFDDPKTTFSEALDQLSKRYNVTFDVYEEAFKFERNDLEVMKVEIANPPIPEMPNTTLATVLKKVLTRLGPPNFPSGATYLIRGDTIEITTNTFAQQEKAVRVYPVADLVIPIPPPGAFVQQQILNSTGAVGILGAGGFQIGGFQIGGFQIGGFQIGGFQIGGFPIGGQFAGVAGAAGLAGVAGLAGAAGAAVGIPGFGQIGMGGFQGNFMGAGQVGVAGGGVNGNFTGGFGLQNQNQSEVLMTLIRQVIEPNSWAAPYDPITGLPIDPLQMGQDPAAAAGAGGVPPNNLGFYPPAMALVVRAPSRIHANDSTRPRPANPAAIGGMGALDRRGNDPIVQNPKPGTNPANDPKKPKLDAKVIWQDALVKGVDNPGLIIAVADYLAVNGEFAHTAEFLKANLRQGIVVKPVIYEALAVALRESGGSAEEIERAEVSAAELEPLDASGFQKAAQAMADQKRFDRAVAFCQQAALLQPNAPQSYSQALLYAELSEDTQAMQWAAGNLLQQDWPYQNEELQKKALGKLESLARKLERGNKKPEADKLLDVVQGKRQRDLVIKLSFQGEADLDLRVVEPCGSTCSARNRQTIGGGIFLGDTLADLNSETYLAAQAFSGVYKVHVDRVYGMPTGNRAQLRVTRNQGTPEQSEEILSVDLTANKPIEIRVDNGRRTETAYVPPPAIAQADETVPEGVPSKSEVLNKLRMAATSEFAGYSRGGIRASTYSSTSTARATPSSRVNETKGSDQLLFQNKVQQVVGGGVEVTTQAVLSADRRSVRVSVNPVFETARMASPPVVNSSAIPGAP